MECICIKEISPIFKVNDIVDIYYPKVLRFFPNWDPNWNDYRMVQCSELTFAGKEKFSKENLLINIIGPSFTLKEYFKKL